jgi:hypothetical protein
MSNRTNVPRIIAVVAVLLATSAKAQTALARRDAPQEPKNRQALMQNQAHPVHQTHSA